MAKRVAKCKYILEYSKLHGGDFPPVPFMKRLTSCLQSKAVKMAIKLQEEEQNGPSSPSASPVPKKERKVIP